MGTIVVGIDGSEESKDALRWAATEAKLRDTRLQVVHTYEYRPSLDAFTAPDENLSSDQVRHWHERRQAEAEQPRRAAESLVDSLIAELVSSDVEVDRVVTHEHRPADVLVEQSQGAEMLVVGARGRGAISGLVLGSVSQRCLHRASCPVVVLSRQRG